MVEGPQETPVLRPIHRPPRDPPWLQQWSLPVAGPPILPAGPGDRQFPGDRRLKPKFVQREGHPEGLGAGDCLRPCGAHPCRSHASRKADFRLLDMVPGPRLRQRVPQHHPLQRGQRKALRWNCHGAPPHPAARRPCQTGNRPIRRSTLPCAVVYWVNPVKNFLSVRRGAPPPSAGNADASPWTLPEVTIVLTYLIVASAWIVGSDMLLNYLGFDFGTTAIVQMIKGLNFVATTAVLLFFVLRRAYGGWREAEQRRLAVIDHARQRFRNLCARVQGLREEDRIRISREIHDELGQLLTGIKMEVRMLENRLTASGDRSLNPAVDKLVEISSLVDDTIVSVQRISSQLRPGALDTLGIGSALIDEAGLFTQRSGIPCAMVEENFPNTLPPEVTTTAFRIFQEAITNVARHAQAARIDASLTVDADVLTLAIHDDGKGIDPAFIEDQKSLGLLGLLERAENVGGHVVFTPHPQKGTDVVLTVPLHAA